MLLYQYWMAMLITDSVLTQICGLSTSHTHGHWLRTFTAVPTTQPYIPSWSLNWVLALAGVWVGMSPLPGDWWCCGMWVSVAVRLVNFCTSDSHSLKGPTSVNQNRFIQCCKWQLNKKKSFIAVAVWIDLGRLTEAIWILVYFGKYWQLPESQFQTVDELTQKASLIRV